MYKRKGTIYLPFLLECTTVTLLFHIVVFFSPFPVFVWLVLRTLTQENIAPFRCSPCWWKLILLKRAITCTWPHIWLLYSYLKLCRSQATLFPPHLPRDSVSVHHDCKSSKFKVNKGVCLSWKSHTLSPFTVNSPKRTCVYHQGRTFTRKHTTHNIF